MLGLGRESVMAWMFGAELTTDAYVVALMIPNLISSVFSSGLKTVGVALFGGYIYQEEKRGEYREVIWSAFHVVVISVAAVSLISAIALEFGMKYIVPGFSPDQLKLAVHLSRIVVGIIFLNTLSGACQAVLQISQKFGVPAGSNIFFNITIISGIVIGGIWGDITTVAWGLLAASAVQLAVQVPATLRSIPPYQFIVNFRHPAVKAMASKMTPIAARMFAVAGASIIERFLASRLAIGSIAALNFALVTTQIPINMLAIPFITVIYSAMTAFSSSGDLDRCRRAYVRGLRILAFIFIPVTVAMILFRTDIIRVLYQRGAFGGAAADMTVTATIHYSIGLLFIVWRSHTIQALAAVHDFTTPLWTMFIATAFNIVCNIILIGPMAHGGIALGKSLSEIVWFFYLVRALRRHLGPLGGKEIVLSCAKIAVASAGATAIVMIVVAASGSPIDHFPSLAFETAFKNQFGIRYGLPISILSRLSLLGAPFLVIFLGLSKMLRLSEIDDLVELLGSQWNRIRARFIRN